MSVSDVTPNAALPRVDEDFEGRGQGITQHVRLSRHNAVLLIEMVQEQNRNAMTADMKAALGEAFAQASSPEVRSVVITGSGKAFCAGGDIKAMQEPRTRESVEATMRRINETLVLPLFELPKPTFAAVNGVAAGAGVGIALACDFRVVSDKADFVFAFSRLGLVPDFALSFTLPRLVGGARAKELALLKGRLTAEEAERWGLVTELCAPGVVLDRAMELAARLAAGPTVALGFTKRMLDRSPTLGVHAALELEATSQSAAAVTRDHEVARQAFLHRDGAPSFEGR
ncbi:enoyl-CoA hydratase/isomerase family protein [Nocardia sp. NPDC127606]|uniref:enoyl-CoA hydratase/isomerase family protein n=1 Tax=Nocardia sp. NPDC127606 TaxID=3345406 RepID=UPI0036316CE7